MNLVSLVAYIVGWLRGGHPERFGVAVLIVNDLLAMNLYSTWRTGDVDVGFALAEVALMLIFGVLAIRSDRWWPLAVTASLALMVLVHVLTIVAPVPYYASLSARVGLWLLLYLVLLAGISERWLAGEPPVSDHQSWRWRRHRSDPDSRSRLPGLTDGNQPERTAST